MRHATAIGSTAVGVLAVLVACGSPEDLRAIREGQREIKAKLSDLEKKIEKIAAAPAPAQPSRPQIDPNKVYDIPAANSPFKGAAEAPIVIAEFSDFQ